MSLGEWDGVAPVAAAIGLLILALWPDRPAPIDYRGDVWLEALEDTTAGQAVTWRDPVSGQRGTLVPAGVFRGTNGRWCRHYSVSVGDDTGHLVAEGVACRLARGGWRDEPATAARWTTRADQMAASPPL